MPVMTVGNFRKVPYSLVKFVARFIRQYEGVGLQGPDPCARRHIAYRPIEWYTIKDFPVALILTDSCHKQHHPKEE